MLPAGNGLGTVIYNQFNLVIKYNTHSTFSKHGYTDLSSKQPGPLINAPIYNMQMSQLTMP